MNQPVIANPESRGWLNQSSYRSWIPLGVLAVIALALALNSQSKQPQMCQLFEGYEVTNSEKQQILIAFGKSNLNAYQLDNNQILVPSYEKAKYLSTIHEHNALPLVFQQQQDPRPNLFMPKSHQQMIYHNRQKRQVREMVLRLPFVREAWIEIDWAESNSAFQPAQPSAAVLVRTAEQTVLNRQQVQTIQGLIAGAIAELKNHQVVVTDANVGVSYDNLDDQNQAELIERVSRNMQRRQYYQRQLQYLTHEYPGVELKIEVLEVPAKSPRQTVTKVPSKFASRDSEIDIPANGRTMPQAFTLNGGGSIGKLTTAPAESPVVVGTDSNVKRASHWQPEVPADVTGAESVRVKVLVPIETVRNHTFPNEVADDAQRFEFIKNEIAGKIRAVVPESVLSGASPISIVQVGGGQNDSDSLSKFAKLIHSFWPQLAIILCTSLLALTFIRRWQLPTESSESPVDNKDLQQVDEDALQSQLASLIDSNPKAAAQVLKSWIRDT